MHTCLCVCVCVCVRACMHACACVCVFVTVIWKCTGKTGQLLCFRCPGWKGQEADKSQRTCKHLKEYLGEEFDKARITKAKKTAYVAPHISVSVLLAHKYDEK